MVHLEYRDKDFLLKEYVEKKKSMQEISHELRVSAHRIQYWMNKHGIKRRTWSDATYVKRNPKGDPFKIKETLTEVEKELFYLAIGLYLGEGKKYHGCTTAALGNTDPSIIRIFLKFLRKICCVEENKIKLELNIYDDVSLQEALKYWSLVTELPMINFSKPIVRNARRGSYKHWSRYGTLTVFVCNKRLLSQLIDWCHQSSNRFGDILTHAKPG